MAMNRKYKSKIYCKTENKMIESPTWETKALNFCPNNQSHVVDNDTVTVIDTDPKTVFNSLKIVSLSGDPSRIFLDEIKSIKDEAGVKIGNVEFFDDRLSILASKEPKTIAKGTLGFFVDAADNLLKTKNSDGKITVYQPNLTKGDLITSDGMNQIKLPVGKNGSVLVADSTTPTGLRWGTFAIPTAPTSSPPLKGLRALIKDNSPTPPAPVTTPMEIIPELPPLLKKGDLLVYDGTELTRLPIGEPGNILVADPSNPLGVAWQPRITAWEFSETLPQGIDGGTFNSGDWITRALNTVNHSSEMSSVVLDSTNARIALKPGLYSINCSSPAYSVNKHAIRLQNVVDNTTVATGTVEFSRVGTTNSTRSQINTILQVKDPMLLELQHRCATSKADNGLGIASNFQDEKYSTCLIVKYSSTPALPVPTTASA